MNCGSLSPVGKLALSCCAVVFIMASSRKKSENLLRASKFPKSSRGARGCGVSAERMKDGYGIFSLREARLALPAAAQATASAAFGVLVLLPSSYTHTHTHIYLYYLYIPLHTHIPVHVNMRVRIHLFGVCKSACRMQACMHACIYACTYACMYVCMIFV